MLIARKTIHIRTLSTGRHGCSQKRLKKCANCYAWISQIQRGKIGFINPLSPHDALKHHFASLKNGLISWNLVVLEQAFSWNCFKNNSIFFHLSPTSSHFHPPQVENCDSNSRLVVDEDDNGKLRLERVNGNIRSTFDKEWMIFMHWFSKKSGQA